jgi:hypothetical protein
MLLFLDLSYEQARRDGRLGSRAGLVEAIVHGAVSQLATLLLEYRAVVTYAPA